MEEDDRGEIHPRTDSTKCISCGLCEKKCPANNHEDLHYPIGLHAAFNQDTVALRGSSSGGVAAILAAAFPGRAFGTAWTEGFEAVVKRGEPEEFKGSKYVQSTISPTVYREISELARKDKTIFIGTPCQVAAVKAFSGKEEKLFTADLLCHGICPPSFLREELKPLLEQFPQTSRISFRDGNVYRLALEDSDGNILYSRPAVSQGYFRAFMEGVSLRENCYGCPFARKERISDITLGDFIGREGRVSWVSVNTDKGKDLFDSVRENHPELHTEDCSYEERLSYPYSLLKPFPKSRYRKPFLRVLRRKGYRQAIRRIALCWRMHDLPGLFYRNIHHIAHLAKKAVVKSS